MPEVKKKSKWTLSAITSAIPSYRNRVIIIAVGMVLGTASLWFTSKMAQQLREKENYEVELWSAAISLSGQFGSNNPLMARIIDNRNSIPLIMFDENFTVRRYFNIPDKVINHPDLLSKQMTKMARQNPLLKIVAFDGTEFFIIYGNSKLQRTLAIFPFVQIGVIFIFIIFGFITFSTSKEDEQNKVWIGLAKETAHQLGTPISSLLGWVEYLRSQDLDQGVVDEMEKDMTRLMKVADRFSKIGSETILSPANVNEIVGNSVMYFHTRTPKNVTLEYNGLAVAPMEAMINAALFEWVVENLLKNSLDALQGQGDIRVNISDTDDWIYIDISDTGKGIPKSNFKRIFEPGFTTKTRGWGLGLSLSKRIIEEYHKGKIFVVDSEPGKGTTIRISLKRIYS